MFKVLKTENVEFYTYELESEKRLKIVLHGVMIEATDEEINEDLSAQGYPVTKVTRMEGKESKSATLVLVEIDRKYKIIYNNLKQ